MSVIKLDNSNFEEEVLKSNIPTIVDFYADWCGPCKMMAPIIEEISEDLQGKAKVTKINVDENQSIALDYEIMSIPTVLIFNKGDLIKSFVGLRDKEEIEEIIKKL